jgi:hypothetical protein
MIFVILIWLAYPLLSKHQATKKGLRENASPFLLQKPQPATLASNRAQRADDAAHFPGQSPPQASALLRQLGISKDEDFVILHSADKQPVPLIWVRIGNTRCKVLLEWFERLLPLIEEKFASGELLVELT